MKDLLQGHIRSIGTAARLVTAVCIFAFVYYGKVVLMPLALAVLIAFALSPVVRRLVKMRIPRTPAVLATAALFMLFLGGTSWFIGGQLASFAQELPSYRSNLEERIREGRALLNTGPFRTVANTVSGLMDEAGVGQDSAAAPASGSAAPAGGWLASIMAVTDPLTTFALVLVLVVLLLLQWSELRGRLFSFVSGNVSHTTQVLADAGSRIGRYLLLQLAYNSTFGLLVGLGLWFLQVPYAALWGLCAALFRYLPYVGPVIAAALPLFVSLMTSSGWSQPLSVLVMFVVLELVSNNFVEPWLYGSRLGVSEIGIVMMTVAWTYVWGPAGLLLATPLTVCLVVLGTHVPCLSFFAKLLGNESELTTPQRLYQRLLAGDEAESASMATQEIQERGAMTFASQTLLPALALAQRDQAARWIQEETAARLLTSFRDLSTNTLEHLQEVAAPSTTTAQHTSAVVLWSTSPFADAVGELLQTMLGSSARPPDLVKSAELTGAVIQDYAASPATPAGVCIVSLDPSDQTKAAGLVRRLKRSLPAASVLLLQPGSKNDPAFSNEAEHTTDLATAARWLAAHASLSPSARPSQETASPVLRS